MARAGLSTQILFPADTKLEFDTTDLLNEKKALPSTILLIHNTCLLRVILKTMNVDSLVAAIIGGLIAGASTILAVKLSRKTAIEVVDRQEFIKASIEFKEAFFDEIKTLQDRTIIQELGNNNFAHNIIKSALEKHMKAFFKFKEILDVDERIRFHICWNTYICKEESEQYQTVFENYFTTNNFVGYKVEPPITVEKEHEMRDLALQRISELFDFSKIHR